MFPLYKNQIYTVNKFTALCEKSLYSEFSGIKTIYLFISVFSLAAQNKARKSSNTGTFHAVLLFYMMGTSNLNGLRITSFIAYNWNFFYTSFLIFRGGSRTAGTSKMELFVIIVNGWKSLTIITKCSVLDVRAVLDPTLKITLKVLKSEWLVSTFEVQLTH